MKITVGQLKQLIREAAYEGPKTASLMVRPRKTSPSGYNSRLKITALHAGRVMQGSHAGGGYLDIHFLNPPNNVFDEPGDIVERIELEDILRSLGFSETAIAGVDTAECFATGDQCLECFVTESFMLEWDDLIGRPDVSLR